MQYIEMSGKTLLRLVDLTGMSADDLRRAGVTDDALVRVSRLGDLELRRPHRWDPIGGLIGDFEQKLPRETGLDWV